MSDRPDIPVLDDAHVEAFERETARLAENARLDAIRDPDDLVEYRWVQRDAAGRIEAVLRGPADGAEKIAWTPDLQARADADFAARRAEKFAAKPRAERIGLELESNPNLLAAIFDAAAKADPTNPDLAAAKAKVDPPDKRKD